VSASAHFSVSFPFFILPLLGSKWGRDARVSRSEAYYVIGVLETEAW